MSTGPDKADLRFRLIFSIFGLGLLAFALVYRGFPSGMAFVEVVLISFLFFGGTAVWAVWKLWKSKD